MLDTKFQLNRPIGLGEDIENVKRLTDTGRRTTRYDITSPGPIGPGDLIKTSGINIPLNDRSSSSDIAVTHKRHWVIKQCALQHLTNHLAM